MSPQDPWRNGSASDSRSEGCVFDSRRVQYPGPFSESPFYFFPLYPSNIVENWAAPARTSWAPVAKTGRGAGQRPVPVNSHVPLFFNGIIGSIPLKDPNFRYIPWTPHVIESCGPTYKWDSNGMDPKWWSFNGMDPNFPFLIDLYINMVKYPKSISKRHSILDSLYDTLITSPYRLHSIYSISFQQIIY
jgi:hypothetical protein